MNEFSLFPEELGTGKQTCLRLPEFFISVVACSLVMKLVKTHLSLHLFQFSNFHIILQNKINALLMKRNNNNTNLIK